MKSSLCEDEHLRPGDQLKQHFIDLDFNGVNIPANRQLNEQRKLVIYKPELIRILDWIKGSEEMTDFSTTLKGSTT